MKILNGKKLAEKKLLNLKKKIKKSRTRLRLVVVQVGNNPVSEVFINQKRKFCEIVGIDFRLFKFSGKINSQELKKKIKKIVKNPANSGVIIQLPLSSKFLSEEFLNLIPPRKDIDILSEKNLGKFYQARSRPNFSKKNLGGSGQRTLPILPPTISGILALLKKYRIELKGKNIVIVGTGRLVGLPLTIQLLKEKATLLVLNEFTKNISSFTRKADILISGVGKPNLIRGSMVKKGVIVIDVGLSKKGKKFIGDVNFKEVSKKANYITPVPGGVGPMTTVFLIENLIKLRKDKL